ncbi:MAG: 5'-nucleotidase C-terminal domain-containing protein [Bacillota bacterium]
MKTRLNRPLAALLAVVLVLAMTLTGINPGRAYAADQVKITILGTSDLHGNIYPFDYFKNAANEAVGLAKVATLIKKDRAANPNTLLVDAGDLIQGTPLVYYHNVVDNSGADPMVTIMNSLKYDSLTVGNHEFNFGMDVLNKAKGEAAFPFLSANLLKADGTPYFTPYIVKTVGGVKVGILGLTTEGVPSWEKPENYAGLTFGSAVDAAKKYVPILRDTEKVDLVVVVDHSGLEVDYNKDFAPIAQAIPGENHVYAVATQVPGIDVMVTGHAHADFGNVLIPNGNGGTVLAVAPKNAGSRLSHVDVTLEATGDAAHPWMVVSKTSKNEPVDSTVTADADVLALSKDAHDKANGWMDTPLGTSTDEFSNKDARLKDTAIVDLINIVQEKYAGTDISLAAFFNSAAYVPKGPVTMRQMASLYIYDNTLYGVEVTGQQLKDAMEWSAGYYNQYNYGTDYTPVINSSVRDYNYDMYSGINYKIDITKPVGSRIVGLTYHGQPIDMKAKYKVAVNNYRATGGTGIKSGTIFFKSSDEVRNLLAQYVKGQGTITPVVDNNWQLTPDWINHWGKSYIDRVVKYGVMDRYADTTFQPDKNITVLEFYKALNKAYGINVPASAGSATLTRDRAVEALVMAATGTSSSGGSLDLSGYADAGQLSTSSKVAFSIAIEKGWVTGKPDHTLQPNGLVTRAEAATILARARYPEITLLSTNDFHGRINKGDQKTSSGSFYGGSSVVTAYISREKAGNPTGTLVMDAGDAFQGTAVSTLMKGEPVVDAMNLEGYDVMELGNHEFDWGVDAIKDRVAQAKFPVLAANVFKKGTTERPDWAKPYVMFEREGLKIGVIGVITTETPNIVVAANVKDLEFRDPATIVNILAPQLRYMGADVVVVLSHVGGTQDKYGKITGELADMAGKIGSVDAVVGGHSHATVAGKINGVPVVEAYYQGRALGEIVLTVDGVTHEVLNSKVQTITTYQNNVTPDQAVQAVVDKYNAKLGPVFGEVISTAAVNLDNTRTHASALGDIITDVMKNVSGADFALTNPGGIRTNIPAGDITVGKMWEVDPFSNTLCVTEMTGAQVKEAIEQGANPNGVVQVSGLKFKYDTNLAAGSRVWEITLPDGTPLDMAKTYKVATNNFMFTGGDGYKAFAQGVNGKDTALVIRDEIIKWMQAEKAAGRTITWTESNRSLNTPQP